jgi:hypothetical protein
MILLTSPPRWPPRKGGPDATGTSQRGFVISFVRTLVLRIVQRVYAEVEPLAKRKLLPKLPKLIWGSVFHHRGRPEGALPPEAPQLPRTTLPLLTGYGPLPDTRKGHIDLSSGSLGSRNGIRPTDVMRNVPHNLPCNEVTHAVCGAGVGCFVCNLVVWRVGYGSRSLEACSTDIKGQLYPPVAKATPQLPASNCTLYCDTTTI